MGQPAAAPRHGPSTAAACDRKCHRSWQQQTACAKQQSRQPTNASSADSRRLKDWCSRRVWGGAGTLQLPADLVQGGRSAHSQVGVLNGHSLKTVELRVPCFTIALLSCSGYLLKTKGRHLLSTAALAMRLTLHCADHQEQSGVGSTVQRHSCGQQQRTQQRRQQRRQQQGE